MQARRARRCRSRPCAAAAAEIQEQNLPGALLGRRHRVPARLPGRDPAHAVRAAGDARRVRSRRPASGVRASFKWLQDATSADPRPRCVPGRVRRPARTVARADAGRSRSAASSAARAPQQGAGGDGGRAHRRTRAGAARGLGEILEALVLEDEADRPDAARPIGELTSGRIRKVHRRMVRMGRSDRPRLAPRAVPRAAQEGQGAALSARAVRGAAVRCRRRQGPLFVRSRACRMCSASTRIVRSRSRCSRRSRRSLWREPGGAEALMAIGVLIERLEADAAAARGRSRRASPSSRPTHSASSCQRLSADDAGP